MMKLKRLVVITILLAGCSRNRAEQTPLRIAISPAAQPASEAIMACLPVQEDQPIELKVRYPSQVDLGKVDLYFRLGEPQEQPGFAAQIASEQIVIAVNRDNAVRGLSDPEASDLFSGRITNWDKLRGDDAPVELWVGPASDESRQAFETRILVGSLIAGNANVAGDPRQILEAVANNAGAAGLLPAAWMDNSVVRIDAGLELPVLAIAAQEPTGAARALLGCLQGSKGQAILAEKYTPTAP